MDSGVIASLFQHPLDSALALLDHSGRPLAVNPAAQVLGLAATLESYRHLLHDCRAELAAGEAMVNCLLPVAGTVLPARLRAVRGEDGATLAFTLSVAAPIHGDAGELCRLAVDSAGFGVWDWDLRGDVVSFGGSLLQRPGQQRAVSSSCWRGWVHPDDQVRVAEALQACLDQRCADYRCQYRLDFGDGDWRWIVDSGRVVARDQAGSPLRMIGGCAWTESPRSTPTATAVALPCPEPIAAAAEAWLGPLYERLCALGGVGGCEIEPGSRRMRWSAQCYRLHGLSPGEVTLEQALALYAQDSREAFEAALLRLEQGGAPERLELCLYQAAAQRVWVQADLELDRSDPQRPRFMVLFRDISQERAVGERVELLAHYDRLTGLPNRFLLQQQVEQAMRAGQGDGFLAMLLIELDGCKSVIDSFGHAIADTLIKLVAIRLQQHLRDGDLFGRFSDDEFIAVLPCLSTPEQAGEVARALIEALAEPLRKNHLTLKIAAHIGIAVQDAEHRDFAGMLRAAGAATLAAKEAGRNNWHYCNQDVLRRVQRRVAIERALHGALDRDEFTLAYQPLISADGNRLPAIEALMRWDSPGLEHCGPDEFIPIAEQCGEIVRLGDWGLVEACRQAVVWDRAGLPFSRIAVNVSAVQLRERGFAERVLAICANAGWPPSRLELELTESALIRDSQVQRHCFDLFVRNGVRLAVDDFGTGFSNLHYLKRFPVQRLKIDRSFVQDVLDDPNTAEVTQAIVHLGHALGMYVVAEGVETSQEERLMREQGCDEIQGYLYSRPLPARAMTQWLRQSMLASGGQHSVPVGG